MGQGDYFYGRQGTPDADNVAASTGRVYVGRFHVQLMDDAPITEVDGEPCAHAYFFDAEEGWGVGMNGDYDKGYIYIESTNGRQFAKVPITFLENARVEAGAAGTTERLLEKLIEQGKKMEGYVPGGKYIAGVKNRASSEQDKPSTPEPG